MRVPRRDDHLAGCRSFIHGAVLAPRRLWVWILAVQLVVELLAGSLKSDHFVFRGYVPFALANSLDAWSAPSLLAADFNPGVPRLRNVLLFIASIAIGSAAGAVVGAFATTHLLRDPITCVNCSCGGREWLGSLCIAPIVMSWVVRLRARQRSARQGPPLK